MYGNLEIRVVGGVPTLVPGQPRAPDRAPRCDGRTPKPAAKTGRTRPARVSVAPERPMDGPVSGSPVVKEYAFGRLQRELFLLLDAAVWISSRQPKLVRVDTILTQLYGDRLRPGKTRSFAGRLRQLQREVNGKLKRAGDPRRIRALRPGWRILIDPALITPEMRKRGGKRGRPREARMKGGPLPGSGCKRGVSTEECQRWLLDCLAKGICRSAELKRLCCQERSCSHKTFSKARDCIGLRAERKKGATGFYWIVTLPPEEPVSSLDGSSPVGESGGSVGTGS